MRDQKIAAIGDKDFITAFKVAGIDVFSPLKDETSELIARLTKQDYAIILIAEDNAQYALETILQCKAKAYPIILPVPSASGSNGFGISGLRHNIEKAIGMDIVFNKEGEK